MLFDEALVIADKLDAGWRPEKTDRKALFRRFADTSPPPYPQTVRAAQRAAKNRPSSINALAKTLRHQYRNVHTDVKDMEMLGLVEKNAEGLYLVPWDEISTVIKLAA